MITLTQTHISTALSNVLDTLHDKAIAYNYGIPEITDTLTTCAGHFVVVAAKTGTGKTAWALQAAEAMARSNLNVAFLSLEMTAKSLAERMVARAGTMAALRHKDATAGQEANMKSAAEDLSRLPLVFVEAFGCTVADIDNYIKAHPGVDVLFIDYLQLIGGRESTAYERSTNASRALATIARDTNKTIIALAQINLKGEASIGEPGLGCIQGTAQYEQDADAVLMLWKEDDTNPESRRCLRIVKNRHGAAGKTVFLDFDGNRMTFKVSLDQTKQKPNKSGRDWTKVNFKRNTKETVDQTLDDILEGSPS